MLICDVKFKTMDNPSKSSPRSLPILRTFSAFSDDSLPSIPCEKNFCAFICEYSQSTSSIMIWEYGTLPSTVNYYSLVQKISNTPVYPSSFTLAPNTVISKFENIYYIAVYTQIYDVEARGFARPFAFVLANQSKELINNVYHLKIKEMMNLISAIQNTAERKFRTGLMEFSSSLKKTIMNGNEDNTLLLSKSKELQQILNLFGIEEIDMNLGEVKNQDYFTLINNELKSFKEITEFDNVEHEFNKFMDSLPTSITLTRIELQVDYVENNPGIDFGGYFGNYSKLALNILNNDYRNSLFKLTDLVSNKLFYYCAFSILSGQTLVIKSSTNTDEAMSLAQRFSIICPFFKENYIAKMETAEKSQCLKYSIVVVKNFINARNSLNTKDKNYVSFLDFDTNVYSGDGCPANSFVFSKLGNGGDASESFFLLTLYSTIKTMANKLILKFAELSTNNKLKNKKEIEKELKSIGFCQEDEPIIKYWIFCYFNKKKQRPVLMGNQSSIGYTMFTF